MSSLGIGNELCKRLYQHGATVYAFSRSKGPLDELKNECPNINVYTVDLGNWNETIEALKVLDGIAIDGLVNNAAIAVIKPFLELTEKDFDELSSCFTLFETIFNESLPQFVQCEHQSRFQRNPTNCTASQIRCKYCQHFITCRKNWNQRSQCLFGHQGCGGLPNPKFGIGAGTSKHSG